MNTIMIYSLDNDFKIYENYYQIPIASYPSYIGFGMIVFCVKGKAKINIHGYEHTIEQNEIIFIFPGQLVMVSETTSDFRMNSFEISQPLFDEILGGIGIISPQFFFYMQSHYHYFLNENELSSFRNYFSFLCRRIKDIHCLYRREYILHCLRILYLDIYNEYKKDPLVDNFDFSVRKKQIVHQFFHLIIKYFKDYREVGFYANQLCITPKYLSTVVKEITGKSAKDWILEYTISEIKSLLRDSTLNIQEIVSKTNFSNQSALGRFFRKHTGMSPSQYRKDKLDKMN
ncbi:AraC family transcriptional regulator [Parabacteroides bouchesdurhonensis]|uniref:AraC family transcriptional regulator n=1 Tax=Parabacteroides bouchesdurhonensis TaxID=1936995 RepID=UPI000E5519B3|nr:helix-turn-helix domain-containing protein [Parabacteroides bouchesdurhonensis]RHJ90156.1 AraC family transcriptional regulator [Bacteroides sp. AM07-16]